MGERFVERPVSAECEEDQVLVGIGDFNGDFYEAYECGPAVDDYMLPDTSIPAPDSGGFGEALGAIILIVAMLCAAKKGRDHSA